MTPTRTVPTTLALLARSALLCIAATGCSGSHSDNAAPAPTAGTPQGQPATALGQQGTYGCWSASFGSAGSSAFGNGVVQTTGNPALDSAINQEVSQVQQFFYGYPATVHVFNEGSPQAMNAYSSPQGYIMLGEYVMLDLSQFSPADPLLPVAGVLSHEWGHQVQFHNGWQSQAQSTALPMELEADYFSGFYMAYRSYGGAEIQSYLSAVASMGSYDFANPSFHGTPQMRTAMTGAGFNLAEVCAQPGAACNEFTIHQQAILAESQLGVSYPAAARANTAEAQALSAQMDWDWIKGIASGHRFLAERPALASRAP